MRKVFSANFAKVAVIAVALAVAATCTVAGTLAAFSATYTWKAETATGSAYSDTDYSLDLFGGRTIMPGDSGSAVLGGPDFGDSVVELITGLFWTSTSFISGPHAVNAASDPVRKRARYFVNRFIFGWILD